MSVTPTPSPAKKGISYLGQWEKPRDPVEPEWRALFEKAAGASTGVSPMRTQKNYHNHLDDIVFLPAQLASTPLSDGAPVSMHTIIGPRAARPLTLELPFFVSHMSFGSLSREAKIALAKGAATVGTASSSGEGGMLPDERAVADAYIFEYSTGQFGATEDVLRQASAVEIKIGQAAKAGMGGHLPGAKVTEEIAQVRGVQPGEMVISPSHHADITTPEQLKEKIDWLREVAEGVPIGVKIAAAKLEADLAVAITAGPDFITLDCRGGATGAAPTHVKDNICLPLVFALSRARRYLDEQDAGHISLIITGGVRTSADMAKCLAMGADAVALATVAMVGIGCQQYRQCSNDTCPVGIATQKMELRERFNIEESSAMLARLFATLSSEMQDFARIIGKDDIHDLNTSDLTALTGEVSEYTSIPHV